MAEHNKPQITQDMRYDDLKPIIKDIPASGKHRSIGWVATVATLGSFLFGYDTGVISGALPYMHMPIGAGGLGLNTFEEGLIGGILLIGAAFGSLFGGFMSDRWGRRTNILILAALFIVGAIGNALSPTVWILYPFRFILGWAVGGASATVPVYLSETAPTRIRGTIVAIDQLMIVTGQLMAFSFNAAISVYFGGPHLTTAKALDICGKHIPAGDTKWDVVRMLDKSQGGCLSGEEFHNLIQSMQVSSGNGHAWQLMLFLCTIPAIALWLGMRAMPESPRWLTSVARYYDAIGALKRVREPEKDGDLAAEYAELLEIKRRQAHLKKGSFFDIFNTPWIRKVFFIGLLLAICNQTTGVNTVMYYAPKVLEYAGMSSSAAIIAQTANGVMSVIGAAAALYFVFRFTRRQILLTCEFSVFAILGLIAIFFAWQIQPLLNTNQAPPTWVPIVILALMGIFMLVVQSANGPVVWTMLGEIFPARVRGIASGTCVFAMWVVNALITFTFPILMEKFGGGITYGLYSILNLIIGIALYLVMPETKHYSIEELEEHLEERYS